MYHRRLIEEKLVQYHRSFPCVLVSGARQVGKSTLIAHLFGQSAKVFTFDPVQDLYGERKDPGLFLKNNPPPLILDEIQYVPELVPSVKRYVDEYRQPGLFLLTGSQQWEVMKRLSESMAGRVAILELPSFSLSEAADDARFSWFGPWLADSARDEAAAAVRLLALTSAGSSPTQLMWRGAFPEVSTLSEDTVPGWMNGYVTTYLQRDVRSILQIRDERTFAAFLALCATLTGQECNYSQIGRDIGLSSPTAQNWLGVLRSTFQWREVPAFSMNPVKRLSQKPKGYFSDTGLAAYLMRMSSPEALSGHPSFGAMFETFVVNELFKQVQGMRLPPAFHHYRQHSGMEVDLVVENDGCFFPIEVKSASTARPSDASHIAAFQAVMGKQAGPGLVLYAGRESLRLADRCIAVPFDARSK